MSHVRTIRTVQTKTMAGLFDRLAMSKLSTFRAVRGRQERLE